MKKIVTTLMLAILVLSSMQAINHLDSAYYGFEYGDECFSANAYFSIVDEQVAVGDSALKFHTDAVLGAKQKILSQTSVEASLFAFAAEEYLLTLKVYKVAGSTINTISTINKKPWQVINWDISGINEDEWVILKQKVSLGATDSTTSQILFQVPSGEGPGTVFIDDFTINDFNYVMDTIDGNHLDHYYYGFECGTETNVDGIFIPATSDDYVSFSYEKNETPETNFYALKVMLPANSSTDLSIQLGNKDALAQSGSAVLPAGDYVASVKVYMDERNITQFTSPIQDNTATVDSEYKVITWSIPEDIALGQWVTLKQIVTIDFDTDSKVQVKVSPNNFVDSLKDQVIYIDDFAFVDYVAPTSEEIYSFDAGFDGGDGVWFTTPADNYFSISNEKTVTGNYALKFSCADSSSLPDNKIQLGLGKADVDGSYCDLDAGTYDVSYKLYIQDGCDVTGINMNIKSPWTAMGFDFTGLARDEWITMTETVNLESATSADCNFQVVLNEAKYGEGTFYIDDITFTVTTPTGLDHAKQIKSSIYPNPASSSVNIVTEEGSSISIYTLSGAMVKSLNSTSTLTTLSVSDMKTGMYLVSISNSNGNIVERLQVR